MARAEGHTITLTLLDQWDAGDEQALEELLQRHLPWIRNHVHHRLGPFLRGKAETCDYVQDAMVEFLRYGPRIRISDEKHFRALIVRIVENTLRGKKDWFTAQRRKAARQRPLPSDTILSLDPPKEDVERPSQAAVQHEREAWIRLGLELIDPDDAELIVLHQWEGRPFDEIAAHLEITADAARMRHVRAVNRLANKVSSLRRGDLARAVGDGLD